LTYVYYRVSDQATAEDLTAEVFVRMVAKIRHYRHRGKPILAWLYTIARNLTTDYYRRNGRNPRMPLDERLVAGSGNPVTAVEGRLAADCLRRALCHLTEAQKLVIVAKFVEDRSNREVARLLGKTEGAVKSLQHRALASLRRAIEKEGCYEP
jgi:RNA polymerase sigma-70 factor (ECF subfamily)